MLRIAIRNLARNRRRTLITLAALFVGVTAMVLMRGLLNGLERTLATLAVESRIGAVQVHRRGYLQNVISTPLGLDFSIEEAQSMVRGTPGVTAAAARIQFGSMLSAGDETIFAAALAVEPEERLVTPRREQSFAAGSWFFQQKDARPGGSASGIVLGDDLARSVGLALGREAALLAPDRDGVLSGELVRVAGLVSQEIPGARKIAIVPLSLAQKLLKMEGRATELAVAVSPLEDADRVAAALRLRLGEKYEVHTWSEVAVFLRQTIERQSRTAELIAYAFLLLTLLGVANTLLMSVMERTREIGTMMAVGVRRAKILVLFLSEALVLGAVGGLVGAGVGATVIALLARRGLPIRLPGSPLPFVLTPHAPAAYLVQVLLIATLGAALFALYPAYRASRLRPVEALAGR
jgi:putative ABC transport system permease protein